MEAIKHENIVELYEANTFASNTLYMILSKFIENIVFSMEYVEGVSLRELIPDINRKDLPSLPEPVIAAIGYKVFTFAFFQELTHCRF